MGPKTQKEWFNAAAFFAPTARWSFNIFNYTEFNGLDTGTSDNQFGQTASAYDPRVQQLGAKILFWGGTGG
jgi:hypothetical protein